VSLKTGSVDRWRRPDAYLKRVIEKMKEQFSEDGNHYKQIYEIDLYDPALDISTYDARFDRNKCLQQPCLCHLSFKLEVCGEGVPPKIHLTVLYRSHYYVEKALGNFMGLARLLFFVCDQTGFSAGPMTCVSTYAKLDIGAKDLLAECNRFYEVATFKPPKTEWKKFVDGVEIVGP